MINNIRSWWTTLKNIFLYSFKSSNMNSANHRVVTKLASVINEPFLLFFALNYMQILADQKEVCVCVTLGHKSVWHLLTRVCDTCTQECVTLAHKGVSTWLLCPSRKIANEIKICKTTKTNWWEWRIFSRLGARFSKVPVTFRTRKAVLCLLNLHSISTA